MKPALRPTVPPFLWLTGFVVAFLVTNVSLVGISDPSTYVQETAAWRAQAIGQDWIDLLFAVPLLLAAATATSLGSRRGSLVLGGGLAYTAYSFAIYAFDIRFNRMFLVYCGIFGASVFGLVALAVAKRIRVIAVRIPRRTAGGLLIATASLFALLWLRTDVPAVLRAASPSELAEVALPTNGIHVLDLSLVLPAMFASGLLLWRGRRAGYELATVAMGFSVLMDLNIAGIVVTTRASVADLTVAGVFVALAILATGLLVRLLRAAECFTIEDEVTA